MPYFFQGNMLMKIAATNNQLTTTINDWNVSDEFKNMNLEEIRAIQKIE